MSDTREVAGKLEPETTSPASRIDLVHQAAAPVPSLADSMLAIQGHLDLEAHCAGPHVIQALQELLSNAVIHGAPPVTIRIRERAHAEIDVADSGEGIPPEWERAVFTPFLNAGTGYLAPSPDSLGLGLNLARALLLASGGDLAYSDGGFTITLRTSDYPMTEIRGPVT